MDYAWHHALPTVVLICAQISQEFALVAPLASPSTQTSINASTAQSLTATPAKLTMSAMNVLTPSFFKQAMYAGAHQVLFLRIMAQFADALSIRHMIVIQLVISLDVDRTVAFKTASDVQLMLLECQLAPLVSSAMWYSTMALPVHLSAKSLTALSATHSTIAEVAATG